MKDLTIGMQTISLKVENGKAFATSLDIAKAFNKRHWVIIRKIEQLVSFDYFVNEHKIVLVKYTDPKGEERKMYLLDRDIFLMITLTLKGEKAERYRLEFIKAFNMLENEYYKSFKNLENVVPKSLWNMIAPYAPYGTISKVNGLPRVESVHGYFRSKRGSKENAKAIAKYTQNSLIELDKIDTIKTIGYKGGNNA